MELKIAHLSYPWLRWATQFRLCRNQFVPCPLSEVADTANRYPIHELVALSGSVAFVSVLLNFADGLNEAPTGHPRTRQNRF